MRPTHWKGTPYPKARKPLKNVTIKKNEEETQCNNSPQALDSLHTQVARTLHQIDGMVLKVQKLTASKQLAPHEVEGFVNNLAKINTNLLEWNSFFEAAANRPNLPSISKEQKLSVQSTQSIDLDDGLGPLISNLALQGEDPHNCTLSNSPLISTSSASESMCDREFILCTPTANRESIYGCTASPISKTPCMSSPPRSVRVFFGNLSESSFSSTPSDFTLVFTEDAPPSEDSLTPEYLSCHNHLVFETTPVQSGSAEQLTTSCYPQAPGFETSPPKISIPITQPIERVSSERDVLPLTPVVPSPFRTPGISLRYHTLSSGNSSDGSPSVIDDVTASTVKRLGPRGLEEKLWYELAIRKADILKSVRSGTE